MLDHQKIKLVCLPFSGGSEFAFRPLEKYWPNTWKISTLTYPGRGHRLHQALCNNMEDLVDDCWLQLRGKLDEPYVLFGHSMGALVAYLLTHRIIENKGPLPLKLILSGTYGPSVLPKRPYRYLFSKEEFKTKLRSYGGLPDEILNDNAAYDFFESIIRSDFKLIETWRKNSKPLLNVPAIVITGTEEDMSEADIQLWQEEFRMRVIFNKIEGDHFFLFKKPLEFVDLVKRSLNVSLSFHSNNDERYFSIPNG